MCIFIFFYTQAFFSCMLVYQYSMHDSANNTFLFICKALFTIHIALKQHNKKKKTPWRSRCRMLAMQLQRKIRQGHIATGGTSDENKDSID